MVRQTASRGLVTHKLFTRGLHLVVAMGAGLCFYNDKRGDMLRDILERDNIL